MHQEEAHNLFQAQVEYRSDILLKDTGTVSAVNGIHSDQCLNIGLFLVIHTNTPTSFTLTETLKKPFKNKLEANSSTLPAHFFL